MKNLEEHSLLNKLIIYRLQHESVSEENRKMIFHLRKKTKEANNPRESIVFIKTSINNFKLK